MKLPDSAVGITDIVQYRDCPRRFEFGMRRHTDAGEHPEAQGPSTAYGSAVHDAIAYAETHDASDQGAIQHAFDRYAKWLDPEHLELLHQDFAVYRSREPLGVRTVAVEREFKIPLFEFDGETVYFRGKLDRLYQRLDNPAVFVHVDYKSSRWPKSEADVHSDVQMWAYNWAIHEEWPECDTLVQLYDQLRHGAIPTRKSPAQRGQIRDWIIHQVTSILRATEMPATRNRWCPWCPIMESCPVVGELSDYALAEIAALAPQPVKLKQDGTPSKRRGPMELDLASFERYTEQLETVQGARAVLKRYEESVKGALKEMPLMRRTHLGYEVRERSTDVWPTEALRAAHDVLGDDFYEVAGLSKEKLTERLGKDDARVGTVLDMAQRRPGATVVQKVR